MTYLLQLTKVSKHFSNIVPEFLKILVVLKDVGTGEALGHVPLQDFAMNKDAPFLFLEDTPFSYGTKCPRIVVPTPSHKVLDAFDVLFVVVQVS